jgi:hypothetical protein
LKKQSTVTAGTHGSSKKKVFEEEYNQFNACEKLEGEELMHCLME